MENNKAEIKFSIIIPVYNTEKYLKKCLQSVLHQTYGNLEIIIIHDKSEDFSGDICDSYASRDERIMVFHREKGDVSSARNMGLDAATGDYIVFVDSDDWVELNFCEEMKKAIDVHEGADIIKADYFIEKGKTYPVKLFCRKISEIETAEEKELLQLDIFSRYYDTDYSCELKDREIDAGYVWAGAYRKELVSALRFQGRKAEDSLFNLYAVQGAGRIIYKPVPLYHYRQNNASASFRYNAGRKDEYLFHYKQCIRFIKKYKKNRKFQISLSIRMANNIIANINGTIAHPESPLHFAEKEQELKHLMNIPCYKKALKNVAGIKYFPMKKRLVFALLGMEWYGAVIALANMQWQVKMHLIK